jgi:hypothetical protein
MKIKIATITLIISLLLFFGTSLGVVAAPDQPLLQISSVSFTPETVSPGAEFKMLITLTNHGYYDAHNITLDILSVAGAPDLGVFSMVGSGSHFFIEEIPSEESATIEIPMVAAPTAEAKNYNLNIQMQCETSGGTVYDFNETVGIFVNESNSMSIIASDRITLGRNEEENNEVTFEIANFGSNPVRGVQMDIVSDGLSFEPNYEYFGTFEKDDNDDFTTMVTFENPGDYPTKIVVKYLDSFNNKRSIERDITIIVPEDQIDKTTSDESSGFEKFLRRLFGING